MDKTPDVVARELVRKYRNISGSRTFSKQCALIAVDHTLSFILDYMDREKLQSVRAEIDKL